MGLAGRAEILLDAEMDADRPALESHAAPWPQPLRLCDLA